MEKDVKSAGDIYNPLLKNQRKFYECDVVNELPEEIENSSDSKTILRHSVSAIKKFPQMNFRIKA